MSIKTRLRAVKSILPPYIYELIESMRVQRGIREREKAIKAEDWIRLEYLIKKESDRPAPPEEGSGTGKNRKPT